MAELIDLSDAPRFFVIAASIVSVVFVIIPVAVVVQLLQDRRRRQSWTPTTARLLATRTEVHTTGTGDDRHQRRSTVGRWEYRDSHGATHTGEGDLDGVWIAEDGETRELEVLVDPADPTRSQARTTPPGPATFVVLVVLVLFALVGVVVLLGALGVLLG